MSRLGEHFKAMKRSARKTLIPYVTAGDPQPDVTVPLMRAMVEAGANILELGVPFSDPMADGPVIQRASERALAHNVSLHDVLAMVQEFRQQDDKTPVVLMGYLNPIEVMGYEAFAQAASDSGVDGVLTVDLPPEEANGLLSAMQQYNVDPIFLLAPTSNDERVTRITAATKGFVYYVSLKGVTGAGNLNIESVSKRIAHLRKFTDLPIGVGFGIKDAGSAARVASFADAVVVGSVLVKQIEENLQTPATISHTIAALLQDMRSAMDQ